ncbi:unnamed protein product [Prorocentrum cordatum]|uniref:RRM domain-containing protein n=1 Tax=Prorocentrum cordatum TaxID=2364126 RepID=A0ABN9WIH4_9DINO|nr:unnamed protein product [Polarella glacialis]
MDSFMRRVSSQCFHSDEYFETYTNPDPFDQASGGMCTSLPSWGSLPTMQPVTMQSLLAWQENHPMLQSSGGNSWNTFDEFDDPRGRASAGRNPMQNSSEHAQDSAQLGPGGDSSAADAQLPSRPGGALLLRGQSLPRRQEDHPILQSSGGESWKTFDEFDHPRGGALPLTTVGALLLDRSAGAAPAYSPTRPPGMPPRSTAETWLAAGPPGEPDRAARARQPASGGRAGASSGTPAAATALADMRARLLAQEQLLAQVQQQAQDLRRRIREQQADLVEMELQQGELVDSMSAAAEEAAPATPGAPAITTLMIRNIPMSVTQRDLLDLIDRAGFENRYDYAYMPTTFDSGTTRGIAFVNFATSSDAREFSVLWNGSRLIDVACSGTSGTVIAVTASATQGYSESARMWKASRLRRIRNPKFHPFIAPRPAA